MKAHVFIAMVVWALAPGSAWANEPTPPDVIPQRARALAERGRHLHEIGNYEQAISAFRDAYIMAPSPGLLFNIAQAYRLEGNCDEAALMYHRYLETGPSIEGRAIALAHLVKVERCAHRPALHLAEETAAAEIEMPVLPPHETIAPSSLRAARIEKDAGIGLTIGGGVALSVAMYYAFRAHDASAAVEAAYLKGARWQDVAALDERGQHSATLAQAFGIGGGLAVATGVTLYVLGKRAERSAPVAVIPTKHGAEVAFAWTF